ncbi:MAG: hypothetical protein JXA25_01335 [Anaerolineales bacterium]|nr:hypothetical protein [Anaerolineales bacterium]
MNLNNISIGLAALAGLVSFLSPCVLALVPAYIAYLSGRTFQGSEVVVRNRWETFLHGLAFVLGFSMVFIVLGAAASALGSFAFQLKKVFTLVGGVLIILFGLYTLEVINIPVLGYDLRRQYQHNPAHGYASSVLMGIFFSAGWSPCVGPILGTILTVALNGAEISKGIILLAAYSAGLAVPFLLTALGLGKIAGLLRTHQKLIKYLTYVTGVLLIIIGILLMTGTMDRLAALGTFLDLGL